MLDRLNQTWFDTVALLGQQMSLTKEQRADGWPDAFKPEQIAVLQRPYKWWPLKDREHEKGRLCAAYRDGLNAALASGKLLSIIKTERVVAHYEERFQGFKGNQFTGALQEVFANEAVYGDKDFHYITAPVFAAWLAAKGEEPSPHVQAWFTSVGVAGAGGHDATTETIEQRNSRWLARLEAAKKGSNRPSDAAVYRQIEAADGVKQDTIKAAVRKAKKDRLAKYREGNVEPLARGKKAVPDLSNVWPNRKVK